MPEALEKWPVKVLAKLLPRHMDLINQINDKWLASIEVCVCVCVCRGVCVWGGVSDGWWG